MICWICQSAHTSDNPVIKVNNEEICEECMAETAQIGREATERTCGYLWREA